MRSKCGHTYSNTQGKILMQVPKIEIWGYPKSRCCLKNFYFLLLQSNAHLSLKNKYMNLNNIKSSLSS